MDKQAYVGSGDPAAIEELYNKYLLSPQSVDISWQKFFEGFEFAQKHFPSKPSLPQTFSSPQLKKEFDVINLINAYRKSGHLFTQTNPVRKRRQYTPTLDIENFGLTQADLETEFEAGNEIGLGKTTLTKIVEHLKITYCRSVGVEYMYIRRPEVIEWLRTKMESTKNLPDFNIEQKRQILKMLNKASVFENFLHKRFTGEKRFSIEGAESLIPALDALINRGSELGVKEFIMGMAHRGRLNVLANILNKNYDDIFGEFEGKNYTEVDFEGDVKYHLGYTSQYPTTDKQPVSISLCPNPSHLETVTAIAEGIARAKIDQTYLGDYGALCPILIHGDAAIAGQGIVYEVIQMAKLKGYRTGGTIHIVINNQVGFTTNYTDARSSIYCTDVGKVTLSPVFHVNGDDVEALVNTMRMAMEFRQVFKGDVFIDLLCYRKYGHNEGDEPRFTQPLLYKTISTHPNPLQIYNAKLTEQGVVESNLVKEMETEFSQELQNRLDVAKQKETTYIRQFLDETWKGIRKSDYDDFDASPETGVNKKVLQEIASKITEKPLGKQLFKKIEKILNDRHAMVFETDKIDWGMAEMLAYGSLLLEGHPVRFSGQDVERGTFSHRHAVIKIEDSEEEYTPLNNIRPGQQANLSIFNSLLSEYAVLGFDYGYAMASPNHLVIWEAQFGDFVNGAQIVVDQYIVSGEEKWKTMSGLVMLLPHGYEGQGAEHSSGRMERFLQSCTDENIQVANCTTPANFFHLLRRQLKREFRKPLVVFTPKSLLRHPRCVSSLKEFEKGGFFELLDVNNPNKNKVTTIVFCSGKIYFELLQNREANNVDNMAIVRVEQLNPLPVDKLNATLEKYKHADRNLWVQEEPENMGAWMHLVRIWKNNKLSLIARPASGTPATGSHERHDLMQEVLMERVFGKSKIGELLTEKH